MLPAKLRTLHDTILAINCRMIVIERTYQEDNNAAFQSLTEMQQALKKATKNAEKLSKDLLPTLMEVDNTGTI